MSNKLLDDWCGRQESNLLHRLGRPRHCQYTTHAWMPGGESNSPHVGFADRCITSLLPSILVRPLRIELRSARWQRAILPLNDGRETLAPSTTSGNQLRGDVRDSNPFQQSHNLTCNQYTNVTPKLTQVRHAMSKYISDRFHREHYA